MKKSFLALASFAAIAVGCQVEKMTDELPLVDEAVVYEAVTEAYAPATKTAMTADKKVVWSANDQIAVFQGNWSYDVFEVTSASVGHTEAGFTLKTNREDHMQTLPYNVAVYPISEDFEAFYDDETSFGVWGLELPSTQKYTAGSFGNGAFPMAAVSEDNKFEFKNLLGAMKLQLKGNRAVKSITVTDNAGNQLAGEGGVYLSVDDVPVFEFQESYGQAVPTSVTLDCGEGVQLNTSTATEFVIALPETEFEEGFTVTLTDTEGYVLRFQSKASEKNYIERSAILSMPVLDVETLTQDVEFQAVPSLTDIQLDIKVNVEGAEGFWGFVVPAEIWDYQMKPSLEAGYMNFNNILLNKFYPGGAIACKYDGNSYTGSAMNYGVPSEYIGEIINDMYPNTKFCVVIVPASEEKDAAMNQGGGEEEYPEDDWGVMSLTDADENSTVAGYSLADAIIYEVSTQGYTTGSATTLTSVKNEGYSLSSVTITPSDDVVAAYYYKYPEGYGVPTEENYLDQFNEYFDTYYDPEYAEPFEISINSFEAPYGSNNKIGVILVDAEGKSSFHVINLALLEIPVSTEALTVTFGECQYDKTEQMMMAQITEWPEGADVYYNFTSTTSELSGEGLSDAQCDILDGPTNYKLVTEDDIENGVIYLEKTLNQVSYMDQTRGLHVIVVKDGKIGSDNCVKFTIPKGTN